MKAWIKKSLYNELIIKLGFFLVIPFCIFYFVIFGSMIKSSDENYRLTRNKVKDYIQSIRQQYVYDTISIANRIDSNEKLRGFLINKYTYSEWSYYTKEIYRAVSGGLNYDNIYIPKIYFTNTTIPRGYNIFYFLSDIESTIQVDEFLKSDNKEKWVLPKEGNQYKTNKTFTPFAGHYTYMRKVYLDGETLFLLTISVPEKMMDDFLMSEQGEASVGGAGVSPPQNEIIHVNQNLIVNGSNWVIGDSENINENLEQMKKQGYIIDELEFDFFPQKIIYIWNPSTQKMYILFGIVGFLVFLILSLTVNIKFIRFIFQSIFWILNDFGNSVKSGKYEKLEIKGSGEILKVGETINVLIDKIQELITLSAQQSVMAKESQLRALQHQINPHFIYNTLEAFSYKMELFNHTEEADAITSFSNMLRYNTSFKDQYATIAEELEQVDNYMKIQRIKYKDVTFQSQISKEFYDLEVLRFIFQPLVENSFSHGYCGKPLHIEMFCTDLGTEVLIELKDNGRGIDAEDLKRINERLLEGDDQQEGIGLGNINQRLQLFYSKSYTLQLDSELEKWTITRFKVPK